MEKNTKTKKVKIGWNYSPKERTSPQPWQIRILDSTESLTPLGKKKQPKKENTN
jgi:hypothetical protein